MGILLECQGFEVLVDAPPGTSHQPVGGIVTDIRASTGSTILWTAAPDRQPNVLGKPGERPAIPLQGWYRIGNSLQPVLRRPCKELVCRTSTDSLLLGNAAQRGSQPTCGSKSGLLLFPHLPTLYVCWVVGSK